MALAMSSFWSMHLFPKPRAARSHARVARAFLTFGAFTSGIGVHYAPSSIINDVNQSLASKLIIGQRILPHVFIRCADARPYELQDLLPADT